MKTIDDLIKHMVNIPEESVESFYSDCSSLTKEYVTHIEARGKSVSELYDDVKAMTRAC